MTGKQIALYANTERQKSAKVLYPTDSTENWQFRADLLNKAHDNPELQAGIRALCQQDILYWINTFCWTYEVRPERYKRLGFQSPHLLFLTWDYQNDFIQWLVEHIEIGRDALTEKSRDMGVSWLLLTVLQWFWQFHGPGNDFLIGSRKEEGVDKFGSMDTLFPKIRYQLQRQPNWLLPKGFALEKHTPFMRIMNPETNAVIKGESNNRFFGTGGRYKAVMLDEFAKWESTDEAAWQSLSDATPCRLPISSANGRENHFYKLRNQQVSEIDTYTLHWTKHPLKDEDWYERETKRRSTQDLAAEVDINYSASISNKAYPAFDYQTHITENPLYNRNLPIILSCDFNIEPMSWVLIHNISGYTQVFDELVDLDRTRTEDHIQAFVEQYKTHAYKYIEIYGDASGNYGHASSQQSNYEIIGEVLKAHGWDFSFQYPRKNPPIQDRLKVANKRLKDWTNEGKAWVTIYEGCKNLINSLEQTQVKGDGIDKSSFDHPADAWSYYETSKHPARISRAWSQAI